MEIPGKSNDTALIDPPAGGQDPRRNWQRAVLIEARLAASNVRTLVFRVPEPITHLPGQYYDIRLTALGGYQAERSYSAASAPEEGSIELGVEILENGEVSPYLWRLPLRGEIEIRGPIGGHFVWTKDMPGPLFLLGGGSGMVPLMSMLRHYAKADGSPRPIIFLISARSLERILYRFELAELTKSYPNLSVLVTLTDTSPRDWQGYARRIDSEMFREVFGGLLKDMPLSYVCGPTGFVEAAAKLLVSLGLPAHTIKTERFG